MIELFCKTAFRFQSRHDRDRGTPSTLPAGDPTGDADLLEQSVEHSGLRPLARRLRGYRLPTLDPHEQALYDDLRNDRLGDRVRLEQERVMYQLVRKVVLALRR